MCGEIVEKIIEKEMIREFNELLDKHIKKHRECMDMAMDLIVIANHLGDDDEEFYKDANNHASAIAGLMMVKLELNGERDYD